MTFDGYGGGPVDPFGSSPFGGGSGFPGFPGTPPPQPTRPSDDGDTLATLSVVFAFVFAPAGAVLGHLALSHTKQRGQPAPQRALIGLTLSYVFTLLAAVVLVVWAVLRNNPNPASTQATSTAAAPTASSTHAAPTPPAPPTVAAADLSNLLLSNDELKDIMGAPAIVANATISEPVATQQTFDPAECAGALYAGLVQSYQGSGYQAFAGEEHDNHDVPNLSEVEEAVVTFDSAAAAKRYLAKSVDQWRYCAGKHLTLTEPQRRVPFDLGEPVENGGITTVRQVPPNVRGAFVRALAAKSNMVVDLLVVGNNPIEEATTIATRILERIPA
jgi:hypothetical protein